MEGIKHIRKPECLISRVLLLKLVTLYTKHA